MLACFILGYPLGLLLLLGYLLGAFGIPARRLLGVLLGYPLG